MNITPQHAKYFANELTRKRSSNDLGKLTASLQDAQVDLNPHQVDAALFAFKSPLSKGALLADEVGLGKTIEAGIILSQKWAERKRKILIICPANLRKQWNQELLEKFYLPSMILEAKSFNEDLKRNKFNPFEKEEIILVSFQFVRSKEEFVKRINWDLVVIDEAHRLRNVYKSSNKIANSIKNSLRNSPKILLTATPLQNSILELYGLISIIDDFAFGDIKSFKDQFSKITNDQIFVELKKRLEPICKRTLRRQVLEYINYTNRIAIVEEFYPYDDEIALYDLVSEYLATPKLYALPNSQRQLMTLILRKLLASSTFAISGTLEAIEVRLEKLLNDEQFNINEDIEQEFETLSELVEEWEEEENSSLSEFDIKNIKNELSNVKAFKELALSIKKNSKGDKLITALKKGFEKSEEIGASKKAIIFTESTRTQQYLLKHLSKNGYKNKIVLFNGSNNDDKSKEIYRNWIEEYKNTDKITGSKSADMRQAIVDHFKNKAMIMIATEAAAEGINLQFCSLLVNYDMPWNPQRIEQRIGRIHRYGQKYDVVVINFLNKANEADKRVYELLDTKFKLFSGVFGASDEILGSIGSGVDFERRISQIYQECRKPDEIKLAFDLLQQEMDDSINNQLDTTKQQLLEHFDDEVHRKLKVNLEQGRIYLNQFEIWLWELTKYSLRDYATFNSEKNTFKLNKKPFDSIQTINLCNYKLIKNNDNGRKSTQEIKKNTSIYRIGHPLAQKIIHSYIDIEIPEQELVFDLSGNVVKIASLNHLKNKTGYLEVKLLSISAFEKEEIIVINCITETGELVIQEVAENLFKLNAKVCNDLVIDRDVKKSLEKINYSKKQTILEENMKKNADYFDREYEKLENWADDMKVSLEKEIKDIDAEIKLRKSEVRKILDLKQKVQEQRAIKELEKRRNEKRKHLFEAQDEIDERKDGVLNNIEDRLDQRVEEELLFTIKWQVV
ncbi:MAG: DEAD/DEAH box helicase family protein [Candidatus Delongbacteria bacterium]|nr:DEAD/DEAH box helicase family protein [Candidatus Delongbacteria bacterium]MBN2835729.1 DEAD/DEAH box helicase family protein [Candidatus Delongbacteria bacterium]